MVNPEGQVEPSVIPSLDPSLLRLSDTEKAFLHSVISKDDEVTEKRIYEVQQRAYEKYPYPCIRAFHFVNLMMAQNAIYPTVVAAGQEDSTALFLEIGCCMGTDIRKLVLDGYPAARVLGCDLRPEYIKLGYELFGDADRCPIRFFTSNVFDLSTEPVNAAEPLPDPSTVSDLSQLRGSLTHIYTGALFHLFDEETQYGLAVRLSTLLRRRPGAVIFGRHQGLKEEGYIDDHLGRTRYGHSDESWPKLWQKVFTEVEGEDFAARVRVQAKLTDMFWDDPQKKTRSSSLLYWSVVIA